MLRIILINIFIILNSNAIFGQTINTLNTTTINEKYSKYLQELESGQFQIDFLDFRNSYIGSIYFPQKAESFIIIDNLQDKLIEQLRKLNYENTRKKAIDDSGNYNITLEEKLLLKQAKKSNFKKTIKIANEILKLDYTNLFAHMALNQTYRSICDIKNSEKHRKILQGLLMSIHKNGLGKSCKEAFSITQISEIQYISYLLGSYRQRKDINITGDICERFSFTSNKSEIVLYFDTTKLIIGQRKLNLK